MICPRSGRRHSTRATAAAELIEKDISGKLEESEREELEQLECLCGAAVEKAFPLPLVDLDSLIRLRDILRAEKEGPGV